VAEPPAFDLSTVVAQFTALRHDVNLQTKATRGLTEQTAEVLKHVAPPADPDEAVRPLVKAVIDIADALGTAIARIEKARETLEPLLDELAAAELPPPPESQESARPGFFARMFAPPPATDRDWRTWAEQTRKANDEQAAAAAKAADTLRPVIAGVSDGYAMSLRRVERVLPTFGVDAIECLGRPFDPEQMEAVEMTESPGQASGTVVEEVRRGYRWKGKLFRFAQVKVAR
jgi:molecular chaperone GrpE